MNKFYVGHTNHGDYGKTVTTRELDKMSVCDYICVLDIEAQKKNLTNLCPIFDKIVTRVGET